MKQIRPNQVQLGGWYRVELFNGDTREGPAYGGTTEAGIAVKGAYVEDPDVVSRVWQIHGQETVRSKRELRKVVRGG